jgi:hypothetical protein
MFGKRACVLALDHTCSKRLGNTGVVPDLYKIRRFLSQPHEIHETHHEQKHPASCGCDKKLLIL